MVYLSPVDMVSLTRHFFVVREHIFVVRDYFFPEKIVILRFKNENNLTL